MKLLVVASCSGGACPTVYIEDGGELVIQGYQLLPEAFADLRVPPGESLVRIPRALLLEAAARLSAA